METSRPSGGSIFLYAHWGQYVTPYQKASDSLVISKTIEEGETLLLWFLKLYHLFSIQKNKIMHIQKIIKRTLKVGVLAVALMTSVQVMGQTLLPMPSSYYDISSNMEIRLWGNYDKSKYNEGISFYTAQELAMRIGHSGNVGIGVYNPKYKLQVNGTVRTTLLTADKIGIGTTNPEHKLQVDGKIHSSSLETGWIKAIGITNTAVISGHGPYLRLDAKDRGTIVDEKSFYIVESGRVGIGLSNPEAKLHVAGDMKATTGTFSSNLQAVGGTFSGNLNAANGTFSGDLSANRVRLNVGTFPDYVFASGYDLMPLEQVEAYIKAHKHLPKVPSAAKVIKEGMNVGQMNILLMEKVEELTLHLIAQNKKMKAMQQKIAALEKTAADKK
jgi:cytoskeletal protein CcmA (bactofilin family)